MKNKRINIDSDVFSILQCNSFDNFTITDIREKLSKTSEYSTIKSRVNRIIKKLVDANLLIKNGIKYSKKIHYQKTPEFFNYKFVINNLETQIPSQSKESIVNSDILNERMDLVELELLSKEGEEKEYLSLEKNFPNDKKIRELFKKNEKEKSIVMGKINAIRKVLDK